MDLAFPLSLEQIEAASRLHARSTRWRTVDRALDQLRVALPGFSPEATLVKAVTINALYGTNVLAIARVAEHVTQVLGSADLAAAGPALVEELATVPLGGAERRPKRRHSFAVLPELEADVRRFGMDKKRLESERTNLVNAVAGGGAGVGVLVERLGAVDEELAAVEARIEVARAELVTARVQALDEAELRTALASFDPVWDELFPRERARILALLIERITYRRADGEVSITFRPSGVKSLARPRAEDGRGGGPGLVGGKQLGREQAGAPA